MMGFLGVSRLIEKQEESKKENSKTGDTSRFYRRTAREEAITKVNKKENPLPYDPNLIDPTRYNSNEVFAIEQGEMVDPQSRKGIQQKRMERKEQLNSLVNEMFASRSPEQKNLFNNLFSRNGLEIKETE